LFGRLSSFARLIMVDRRGCGLSDHVREPVSLEEEVADVLAVLDAVGSAQTAVLAHAGGGPLAAELAVRCPDRVRALILYAASMRNTAAPGYEWAPSHAERLRAFEHQVDGWGDASGAELVAPSRADDPRFREWFGRLQRLSVSPGSLMEMVRATADTDARPLLPRIRQPTLVLHRSGDRMFDVRHSRLTARLIPDARYVELAGEDHMMTVGDTDAIADEVEEFLTGRRRGQHAERALVTVMFTDIVDSTQRVAQLGDQRWRDLLATHEAVVRRELDRFDGRLVKSIGDGLLVAFTGPPSQAVRCALAVRRAVAGLGIEVRVGLHTGECELIGDDLAGMAVHIAARVGALAQGGEIVVSGTTYGCTVGTELEFEYRGSRSLKGVPAEWPLFAVTSG
jgi:class 3 adenylate cyclase